MNATRVAALGLVIGALGCGHTKTTEATSPSGPEKVEERTPPADHPERISGGHAEGGAKHENPAETKAIPVVANPEGLLAPGAEAQIRDKLASGGYLDKKDKHTSLEAGVRKFQEAHDLPETGIPDHKTVQAMGLDPGRIFKHAE